MAHVGSGVWGTSGNFNGFRVLASLLHRRRATEVNQTLHRVCPSPWLVGLHILVYIRFWELLPLQGILPGAKFTLLPSVASYLGTSLHGTRAVGVSQTLRRSAEGATYIRQGGHNAGHRPTF